MPIEITLALSEARGVAKKIPRKWSYAKADWPAYTAEVDAALSQISVEEASIDKIHGKITEAMLSAAKKFIPRTYPGSRQRPILTRELKRIAALRKRTRKQAEKKGTPECARSLIGCAGKRGC